jgi:hypothetical protein
MSRRQKNSPGTSHGRLGHRVRMLHGTAACLRFAGQLLSQLGAPYNPRGHNLRRSRPSRHGDQRARRMITGTVDLVREDY